MSQLTLVYISPSGNTKALSNVCLTIYPSTTGLNVAKSILKSLISRTFQSR